MSDLFKLSHLNIAQIHRLMTPIGILIAVIKSKRVREGIKEEWKRERKREKERKRQRNTEIECER